MTTLFCSVTELEERPPSLIVNGGPEVLELVHAELENFGKPVVQNRQRKLTPEACEGLEFLQSLANNQSLWHPSETVPWTEEAELEVDAYLAANSIGQRLLGVMHILRSVEPNKLPTEFAAGFLILSRLELHEVSIWLDGVNLKETCDAGCKLGGIVAQAATIARQNLGLVATA